jgi:thiol-disulfide isomerase/thioredoxin
MTALRALLSTAVLLLAIGCATGKDAVVSGGGRFQFVAPGGQTKIFYPPERRGGVPELSGESLTEPGRTLRLSDYAGKVVVLTLWGAWCPPCRAEADDMDRVQRRTGDRGVQVLGINLRDNIRGEPIDFVRDRGLSFPSIYDPPGRSLLALSGYPRNVIPSTVVLDRGHRVAAIFLTEIRDVDLEPVVTGLAAEI